MKKSHIAILALLAIAAAVVYLWISNPLNGLVKAAMEKYGTEMTQAQVRVSKVDLSPTDGKGALSGVLLGNPKGFKTDHAFKVAKIELALEPASLTDDVILIDKIQIDSPDIIYEKNDGGTNFDAIQRNVEHYLGASKKPPTDENNNASKEEKKAGKKMIIKSLVIRNAKVNYNGLLDLKLPDIELRNIGKKSGGATSAQVTKAIVAELNKKMAIELAKVAAIGAVGGVPLGVGLGIKSLLGE
jgi:hypothetical protein